MAEPGQPRFHVADYCVFVATIVISLGIGIYFALTGGRQKTTGEYLMGDRNLKVVPVAISMLVSFISAIGILGVPAEMYAFGTQFSMYVIAACLGCVYGAFIFVPLFYPLKLTSSFEYLELRYQTVVTKLIGTIVMLLNQIFHNGTGLFAPSVALQAVSGFPLWASIILAGISTTIYTTIGGMKAVIWTDVFQSVVILIGLVVVTIVGAVKVGGLATVWELNQQWDRIHFFDFDPDPTKRTTFWSIVVLMSILWMCMTAAQPAVQRYCALPSQRQAQISVFLNIPGFVVIGVLCSLCGTIAFAYYAKIGCDPMSAGYIDNPNQILPYFVVDVIGYPGIPGLFVACLYSGSVSTVSSSLNSMAAVTWEDLLKWKLNHLSEKTKTNINKLLVVVYGALSIVMAFAIQHMGGTFIQIVFSILGTTAGPIVGLYFLGGLVPSAGPGGAILGAVLGLVLSGWMAIGGYTLQVHTMPLPMPTANCPRPNVSDTLSNITMNSTSAMDGQFHFPMEPELHGLQKMYAVSYLWYPMIGITVVMLVGIITSCLPGLRMPTAVQKRYLFPCLRSCGHCCSCISLDEKYYDDFQETKNANSELEANKNLIYKPSAKNGSSKPTTQNGTVREKLLVDGAESAL